MDTLVRYYSGMFSQTTEYALRAMVNLAQVGGGPQTAQEISAATKVPPGYLAKILRQLSRNGLLDAQRGLGGGFALARPASSISVLDVLRAADSDTGRIRECPLGIEAHSTLCALHQLLDDLAADAERRLAGTTLEDIVESRGRSRPLCDVTESEDQKVRLGIDKGGKE